MYFSVMILPNMHKDPIPCIYCIYFSLKKNLGSFLLLFFSTLSEYSMLNWLEFLILNLGVLKFNECLDLWLQNWQFILFDKCISLVGLIIITRVREYLCTIWVRTCSNMLIGIVHCLIKNYEIVFLVQGKVFHGREGSKIQNGEQSKAKDNKRGKRQTRASK